MHDQAHDMKYPEEYWNHQGIKAMDRALANGICPDLYLNRHGCGGPNGLFLCWKTPCLVVMVHELVYSDHCE